MNARVNISPAGSETGFLPLAGVSPQLVEAIDGLARYLRDPDITLAELKAALLGTGVTWSADGKLTYSATRMALVDEFNTLVEIYGENTPATGLFL